jgi:AcrR family transcriptional regulator
MAAAGKPRGEYAKSAERREEILRAGMEVFSSAGFRSGSLRDVAERVGMSQAGLLHHFPSKNELLEALLARRDEESVALMGGEMPLGADFLRAMVGVVEHNVETPGLVALFATLSAEATAPDHPVHQYFVDRYRFVVGSTRRALEVAAEHGVLREGVDPDGAARDFVALMDGLQVQWLLEPDTVDMVARVRDFAQSLVTVELWPGHGERSAA